MSNIHFKIFQTNAEFIKAVREWEPQQLTIASKGLDSRLERTLKLAIPQRRANTAITVVIIDDDGSSAFMTNPANFGSFSEFVGKRHYVYTLIASRKAERFGTFSRIT